jgi:exonuclease SbcD
VDELRLLHFADLHLGVETNGRPNTSTGLNQRIHDVCDRLDEVCAIVEEERVHAVLFAGDAFMHPRPSPTLQKLFAERIRRLVDGGAAVFLLVGNHDLPKMAGVAHPHSIYTALDVEGVVVGDRAQIYSLPIDDLALQVAALPHFSRAQVASHLPDGADAAKLIEEQVTERVRALGREIDPALPAVFAGHCHVNKAEIGAGQTLFNVSDVEVSLSTLTTDQPFPYFALGHVHRRQILDESPFVAYSGSLERVDFGEGDEIDVSKTRAVSQTEAEPKGFFRFDLVHDRDQWRLAESPRFHHVDARRFVTIRAGRLEAEDPSADLSRRLTRARDAGLQVTDAFVRVVATVDATDRRRVTLATVRGLLPEAYDVRLALEVSDGAVVRDPRFATRMSELEALERYLETREDWADDHDELLRAGRELIAEVGP